MNQARKVRMLALELANWMTAAEAAQYAGIGVSSVRRALFAQELPGVKTYDQHTGGWLITRSDVELWAYHREGLRDAPGSTRVAGSTRVTGVTAATGSAAVRQLTGLAG